MKYIITLLTNAGTYETVTVESKIDIEQTWEHLLTDKTIRAELAQWPQHQVVDIDPEIDFKLVEGKYYANEPEFEDDA